MTKPHSDPISADIANPETMRAFAVHLSDCIKQKLEFYTEGYIWESSTFKEQVDIVNKLTSILSKL